MKKTFIILAFCLFGIPLAAQTFIPEQSDTTTITEYYDGHEWAYHQIEKIVVGMTNYQDKNDYGSYYQIGIMIQNLGDKSIVFDPEGVSAKLMSKSGQETPMKVYTYERYMKMIKNQQAWAMALTGFAAGLNAGSAGYQTSYSTGYVGGVPYTQVSTTYNTAAATAANMAAQTQIMTLGSMMENDKKVVSQGYLKKTTVHSGESIIGIMNIKRQKGQRMTVNVDIDGTTYSFDWDIAKKKK